MRLRRHDRTIGRVTTSVRVRMGVLKRALVMPLAD
jgi:hypothetical protein